MRRSFIVPLMLAAFAAAPAPAEMTEVRGGSIAVSYDLSTGQATVTSGAARVGPFRALVALGDRPVTSRDYARRTAAANRGELVVTLTAEGLPTMRQWFRLTAESVLVSVEVSGKALRSNRMAPVVSNAPGCLDIGVTGDARALKVPFDNDKWARYDAAPLDGEGTSYEVAAFYDNGSRHGWIVGSVTHDVWKTGVTFRGSGGRLDALEVFGGVADSNTRDVAPHGSLVGETLRSPEVFVGFFQDWRNGLQAFADANARKAPPLEWSDGVPFGWNSWGKIQSMLSYEKAVAVSDAIARDLQPHGFTNRDKVYINLDSYWDNLSDEQLRQFVKHTRSNGQKAGVYFGPFVYWGTDLDRVMEGSTHTFGEAALRDTDGRPIALDGAMALDPTHPGTLRRIDRFIARFRKAGFAYIKLDFLTHGALEGGNRLGEHHDSKVRTGIQAYNAGMRHILKCIGGAMFVSASISPLFPHRYAHARRVCCDSYGSIGESEYVLNSAAYGWWMGGRLYPYNDADHLVMEGHTAAENRSRVTSAIVAGGPVLNGDDLSRPEALKGVRECFTNAAVNAEARLGRPFRPAEGNTGRTAPDTFVRQDGDTAVVALFNFDSGAPASRKVGLARLGLRPNTLYRATDLWTGRTSQIELDVSLQLAPADCALLQLEPMR